jgi:tetratricopeptide (TPR) repeat protein
MAPAFLGLAYYLRKEHAEALKPLRESVARAANFRAMHLWLAAAHAQLGQKTEACAAAAEAMRVDPTYTIEGTSRVLMPFKYPEHAEHFFDGLRKAGLPEK